MTMDSEDIDWDDIYCPCCGSCGESGCCPQYCDCCGWEHPDLDSYKVKCVNPRKFENDEIIPN
jgi:hypothetical protein